MNLWSDLRFNLKKMMKFWLKIILQILTFALYPSRISFFAWKWFFQLHETHWWWDCIKNFMKKLEWVQNAGKIGFFILLMWKSMKTLSCKYWCQIEEEIWFMAGKSLVLNFNKLGHTKIFLWRWFSILMYCDHLTVVSKQKSPISEPTQSSAYVTTHR